MLSSKLITYLNTSFSSSTPSALMSDSSISEKYIINTELCKMIAWPLFDDETRPIFRNHSGHRFNCRERKLINVKRINETKLSIELSDIKPLPQCFVTELLRVKNFDSIYRFGPTYGPIKNLVNLPKSESVSVKCYRRESPYPRKVKLKKLKVFEEIVPLIPPKKLETVNFKTLNNNIPNVLMLGIDSISWLNFKRHFKLTEKLAQKYDFHPIYGYNKIGDNTFPNLVAILTGNFYDKFWNESVRNKKYFDSLPFIWKEYSQQNFITALIEDLPKYSLFNYNRLGFMNAPTDYYLRPVSLAIEKHLNRFCYKNYLEMEVIMRNFGKMLLSKILFTI